MIDQSRIEQIRQLPVAEAKAAMKVYAKELGVSVKSTRSIDNMVSEMGAQLQQKTELVRHSGARVKGVTVVPNSLNPIKGRGFILQAKLTDIDNTDQCTFQWQKKGSGEAGFSDIAGETKQTYQVEKCGESHVAEYQCKVAESDGTETTSDVSTVMTLSVLPNDFPEHTLYKAKWIEFYGQSFAPVGWHGLYAMYDVLADDTKNDSPSNVHKGMMLHTSAIPIVDLISNTTELVATDSKNGYRHILSSDNYKNNMPTILGRFIK